MEKDFRAQKGDLLNVTIKDGKDAFSYRVLIEEIFNEGDAVERLRELCQPQNNGERERVVRLREVDTDLPRLLDVWEGDIREGLGQVEFSKIDPEK